MAGEGLIFSFFLCCCSLPHGNHAADLRTPETVKQDKDGQVKKAKILRTLSRADLLLIR